MYERMIVTDDGSELARAAIPRAAAIAVASGSEVLVVRVSHAAGVELASLLPGEWSAHVGGGAAAGDREEPLEAEPHLSSAVDALRAAGVGAAGSLLVRGEPADAIVEVAERLEADLLVLSSHGLGGVKRAVLGSVASHVVQHARGIPVLVCRPLPADASARIEHVLLTLDGSELSTAALPHAEHLARSTGARLVLMRVTQSVAQVIAASTPVSPDVPTQAISVETAERVAAEDRQTAEDELGAIASRLQASGLGSVTVEIEEGDAGDVIVGAADRLHTDVVVMATHGRGGLGRALFGSVADYVTRHLEEASVLLVRPEGGN